MTSFDQSGIQHRTNMLSDIRAAFQAAIHAYPWVSAMANNLPLSALLNFLDTPRTLHALELCGRSPLWSWPVTPAGSRLLLNLPPSEDVCCLDQFGRTPSLMCLDGRYGDIYNAANPETLRLCLANSTRITIKNNDQNMGQPWVRLQNLTVVRVHRLEESWRGQQSRNLYDLMANLRSSLPWILWLVLVVFSGLMYCWLTLAFLVVVPATGALVFLTHGGKPRELRLPAQINKSAAQYNRLVVAALHMNDSEWLAFYGESGLVNSLLNHRLRQRRLYQNDKWTITALTGALRISILSQWALAVGAAALSGWDGYLITFWIVFCIFAHTSLFPLEHCANDWAHNIARLDLKSYTTTLSGRRALLTTLIALNPDTFASLDGRGPDEDHSKFATEATLWIDPILRRGPSDRTEWEEATRRALVEAKKRPTTKDAKEVLTVNELEGGAWIVDYKDYANKWCSAIQEGINLADMIIERAGLTGRLVQEKNAKTGV